MNIPKDWLPTPKNINALPQPLKSYVHDLQTNCDPQYTMQDLTITKDINKHLETALIDLIEQYELMLGEYPDGSQRPKAKTDFKGLKHLTKKDNI